MPRAAPKVVKSDPPAPSPSQAKRKSANPPKGNPTPKKGKTDPTATTPKVDKAKLIELRRTLRDTEDQLQSAKIRVRRLEDREDEMKNSYEAMTKKSKEKMGDYDDLADLKRATYNHFLTKWETVNENNQGNEITELKHAFPLTLRKYFFEEIEKDKSSLK